MQQSNNFPKCTWCYVIHFNYLVGNGHQKFPPWGHAWCPCFASHRCYLAPVLFFLRLRSVGGSDSTHSPERKSMLVFWFEAFFTVPLILMRQQPYQREKIIKSRTGLFSAGARLGFCHTLYLLVVLCLLKLTFISVAGRAGGTADLHRQSKFQFQWNQGGVFVDPLLASINMLKTGRSPSAVGVCLQLHN